jgi:Domain of unknown function (DUF1830)
MSQILDPMPPSDDPSGASSANDRVLCCYVNATSSIQVVRITDVPNWYFERVAFPGQRLIFEAFATAHLEIHTGMMASSILSDTIPCTKLAMVLEESPAPFAAGLDMSGLEMSSLAATPETAVNATALNQQVCVF